MNANANLVDELAHVLRDPRDPAFFLEAFVVVGALLVAWVAARLLRHWLAPRPGGAHEPPRGGWHAIMLPLAAFALLLIGRSILLAREVPTPLVSLAITLALTYALVRLLVYALRRAFAPNALLLAFERVIATAIWIAVVLHVLGFLPRLQQQLGGMSVSIGKQEVSLLLVLQLIAAAALTIVVALWLSRFLESRIMAQTSVDLSLRAALAKILRIMLLFLAVLIALPLVGIDITALSVFGGALGVGVGFGLQKVASNYVSGFIILLERSIRLGDVVSVNERQGIVAKINARYTVVRSLDGTEAIVPNETFITNTVINHSAGERRLLIKVSVQISYRSDFEKALQILERAGAAQARVLAEPAPAAAVRAFAESGVELELYVWVGDPEQGPGSVRSDILRSVWPTFQENGITIPHPQREVRILDEGASSAKSEQLR